MTKITGTSHEDQYTKITGTSHEDQYAKIMGTSHEDQYTKIMGTSHEDQYTKITGTSHEDQYTKITGTSHEDQYTKITGTSYEDQYTYLIIPGPVLFTTRNVSDRIVENIACWILQTTKTHSEYVTHCFSTATVVARTRLRVTLCVHCLSCNRGGECLLRGTGCL
jgi:hypothetical protein